MNHFTNKRMQSDAAKPCRRCEALGVTNYGEQAEAQYD